MGLFDLVVNTVSGTLQATVNVAKGAVGVVAAPFDDGETLEEAARGIRNGVSKIGDARPENERPSDR